MEKSTKYLSGRLLRLDICFFHIYTEKKTKKGA